MRKRVAVLLVAVLTGWSAPAFEPVTAYGLGWIVQYVGLPVSYALGCAFAYSPPIRAFGTESCVCGLDWGSMACHARDVYGLQLSLCGGAVEHRLCGLQVGLLATGYAARELPFGDYHFFNLDWCSMNGVEFGTFAAKTARANGLQASAVYAEASEINGLQVALVSRTRRLHGIQVGLYNEAANGVGMQVGALNCTDAGFAGKMPVVNFVY